MRADMAKVIVERPRYGSRARSRKKGYRKYTQKTEFEELPKREPMLGHWRGLGKCLNEHLGPMRKFLRSRVGRPWNKVHQELCEHVSFDNAVQKHLLTHIYQYVERYVDLCDGRVVVRGWRPIEVRPGHMYVCPRTGLLKVVRKNRSVAPRRRIQGDASNQYHRRGNEWWEVRLRKRPDCPGELWDVWFERAVAQLSEADLEREFGGKLIAISKRLLTSSEARELLRSARKARLR